MAKHVAYPGCYCADCVEGMPHERHADNRGYIVAAWSSHIAEAILPIIQRERIAAGEKVRDAAADLMEGRGGVIPLVSYYAKLVSGNNMPHPSGDDRNSIRPEHQRRAFDRVTGCVAHRIRALSIPEIVGGGDA